MSWAYSRPRFELVEFSEQILSAAPPMPVWKGLEVYQTDVSVANKCSMRRTDGDKNVEVPRARWQEILGCGRSLKVLPQRISFAVLRI